MSIRGSAWKGTAERWPLLLFEAEAEQSSRTGISGGVHITTSGIGVFSGGNTFCAMSGCTSVIGAETRYASDWGAAAATGCPPERAACVSGLRSRCACAASGRPVQFRFNPLQLYDPCRIASSERWSSTLGVLLRASTRDAEHQAVRQDGDHEEAWLRARPWWGRRIS